MMKREWGVVALMVLLSGCAAALGGQNVPAGVDVSLLPKASPDATEILYLQSNTNCQFSVDGQPVITGKRVRILVTKQGHQLACKPDGYRAKEDYIQPPYDPSHPVGFTFLLEDKLSSGELVAESTGAAAVPKPRTIPVSDVDTLPAARSSAPKKAYAIVIGIERYREKLPAADFADRDAQLMGEYLTKVLGYPEENVVIRLNEKASRTDLEKYLENWLPNHVEKGDSVFFYFSGHGAPNARTGEAYLVPFDGDPAFVETTGYPLKRLYESLDKLPAQEIVVLLDSCFSGAGGRSVIAKGSRPMVLSVENALMAKGKTVVLSAGSGDQISSTYDQKGHGLLTYFFLKGLQGEADKNKDGAIDLHELFDYVKPQVERVARRDFNNEQTPQLLGSPEMLRKVRLLEGPKP